MIIDPVRSMRGRARTSALVKRRLLRATLWLFAVLWSVVPMESANAEMLDEVDVRAEGADTVIRIRFNPRVQYLRHVPTETGDLLQIFFQIVGNDESPSLVPEFRRSKPSDLAPGFTVTYPLQPTVVTKKLLIRFAKPVRFTVRPGSGNRSIEIVLAQAAVRSARKRAIMPDRPNPGSARYAITLDSFPSEDTSGAAPLPPEFADYDLFTSKVAGPVEGRYELNLGYFPTSQAAEATRARLIEQFPRARVKDLAAAAAVAAASVQVPPQSPKTGAPPPLTPGPAPATPATAVAPSAPAPADAAAAPAKASAEPPLVASGEMASAPGVEAGAEDQMKKARAALAAGDNEAALQALNQVLFLPPNQQSKEAQELVGQVRERLGETEKARAEYELYLKLYPEGDGAARVRERLVKLGSPSLAGGKVTGHAASQRTVQTFNGNIAQYYYDGVTRSETAFSTPTTVDRASLSSRDLSSLVTTVDLNGRLRNEDSDTRMVIRNTNSVSFLSANPSINRLTAAYVDYRGLKVPLSVRAGRQNGVSGGVNGRFDGAIVGWGFAQKYRANVVAGFPVDYRLESNRKFLGFNVDAEGLADHWTGNAFVINQTTDGVQDRRAVGGEVRYFNGGRTVYSLLDYDVGFKTFNVTMLQGTWQTEGLTTYNLLLDRRKAPLLATTNAVIGQPTSSISTLLQTYSLEQLRQRAEAVTADVTQALIGVTTPVSAKWQLGTDFRLTAVGALPAVTDPNTGLTIPATPATGNIYGYSVQAIGSNLYSVRDINSFNITFQKSPSFNGQFYSWNNLTALNERWTIEPALRFYHQLDDFGTRLRRITPGLRLTYRWQENIALESEFTVERTDTKSATTDDRSTRRFLYVGYRYQF
jgi:tetratricopeptide (TPR) repeat protein